MAATNNRLLLVLGPVILLAVFSLLQNFPVLESTRTSFLLDKTSEKAVVEETPTKDSLATRNPQSATIVEESEIDWSDKIFEKGHYESPIVVESHKLVFFPTAKAGSTVFKRLFRRMMGYSDWLEKMPHNYSDSGLKRLFEYSRDEQLVMMTSPEWTRAIFVREPIERTLSAYLDKGLRRTYMQYHCCGRKGPNKISKPLWKERGEFCDRYPFVPFDTPGGKYQNDFTFEYFVNTAMTECYNVHWNPQHIRIEKTKNWKLINFVGKHDNNMADSHLMLKKIGAFEEFGASGWGTFRNESIFQKNHAGHGTGSSSRIDKYYTPELRKRVFEHVRGDYEMELFNFTIPPDLL